MTPGPPGEDEHIRSFNARVRDEILNGVDFCTLRKTWIVTESWRWQYNSVRSDSSLGYQATATEVSGPSLATWLSPFEEAAPKAPLVLAIRATLH